MWLVTSQKTITPVSLDEFVKHQNYYRDRRLLLLGVPIKTYQAMFVVYWGIVHEAVLLLSNVLGNDDFSKWLLVGIESHLYIFPNMKMTLSSMKHTAEQLKDEGFITDCYGVKYMPKFLMGEIEPHNIIDRFWFGSKEVNTDWGYFDKSIEAYESKGYQELIPLKSYVVIRTISR